MINFKKPFQTRMRSKKKAKKAKCWLSINLIASYCYGNFLIVLYILFFYWRSSAYLNRLSKSVLRTTLFFPSEKFIQNSLYPADFGNFPNASLILFFFFFCLEFSKFLFSFGVFYGREKRKKRKSERRESGSKNNICLFIGDDYLQCRRKL